MITLAQRRVLLTWVLVVACASACGSPIPSPVPPDPVTPSDDGGLGADEGGTPRGNGAGADASASDLVIYPDPVGLEKTTNLTKSSLYTVTVNGQPTFVYRSVNRRPENSAIKEAHFVYFSFRNGPVTLSVTKRGAAIGSAKVRPYSLGVTPAIAGDTLTLSLASPKKFLVQIDGDGAPLIVLADTPDTNVPSGPHVTRFGPGFHDIGESYDIPDNQTIYVDGGAVVKGTFGASSSLRSGVTLRGRGIVYAGDYAWPGGASDAYGKHGIFHQGVQNSLLEGIIALDSEYWNFGIKNTNTEFANLKIIAWERNTDGIWYGPGAHVHDGFIMTDDDSIRPAEVPAFPDGSTTRVDNMVVWHEAYGRPLYMSNYDVVQNVTYSHIEYIRSEHSYAAQSLIPSTTSNQPHKIQNITFENIVFEEIVTPAGVANKGNFFTWVVSPGSSIANITFRNFSTPMTVGSLAGLSATEKVSSVLFDGVYRDGVKMTNLAQMGLSINSYVEGITFQ